MTLFIGKFDDLSIEIPQSFSIQPHETAHDFIDPTTSLNDYQTNLDWVLINFWNLYRATQDADLLPDLYALLRGEVNKQVHIATKRADGVYTWPSMGSPEYPAPPGPNTNYQLALTKWGLTTLLKICDVSAGSPRPNPRCLFSLSLACGGRIRSRCSSVMSRGVQSLRTCSTT